MSWKTTPVKYLHIELSTYCNAACPLCPRFFHGTTMVHPELELTSISIDQFKNYFPVEFLKNLKRIMYCGTMGDPLMAKDSYHILKYVNEINPDCIQILHTNGGMRDEEFWAKLGQLFSKNGMQLVFSIDGLEDTNHIYRRKVNWEKLINNVTTFIKNGGYAIWEFLIFKHNQHQIAQAEAFSKELGFKEFRSKKPNGFETFEKNTFSSRSVFDENGNESYKLFPSDNPALYNNELIKLIEIHQSIDERYLEKTKSFSINEERIKNFNDNQSSELLQYEEELDQREIKCNSLCDKGSEIYVNAQGIVFPCCFVATRYDSFYINFIDVQVKSKIKHHLDNLDLNKKTIIEIIDSKILDKIFIESWNKNKIKDGKLAICAETCGKNSWLGKLYVTK